MTISGTTRQTRKGGKNSGTSILISFYREQNLQDDVKAPFGNAVAFGSGATNLSLIKKNLRCFFQEVLKAKYALKNHLLTI